MTLDCRQALSNTRPSCPGRKEFCRADLVEWGLLVEMGTSSSSQVPQQADLCFIHIRAFNVRAAMQMPYPNYINTIHKERKGLLLVGLSYSTVHRS